MATATSAQKRARNLETTPLLRGHDVAATVYTTVRTTGRRVGWSRRFVAATAGEESDGNESENDEGELCDALHDDLIGS